MLKKFFKREDKTQEFKPKIKKFHNSFIAQSGEVLLQRQKNKLLDIRILPSIICSFVFIGSKCTCE
jgi:hypothetical protein